MRIVMKIHQDLRDAFLSVESGRTADGILMRDPLATLFYVYCDRAGIGEDSMDHAERMLESSFDESDGAAAPQLLRGALGIGWVVEQTEPGSCVELGLLASLRRQWYSVRDRIGHDLLTGATGVGVFLLETPPSSGRNRFIGEILKGIRVRAVEDASGNLCWRTPAEALPRLRRLEAPLRPD